MVSVQQKKFSGLLKVNLHENMTTLLFHGYPRISLGETATHLSLAKPVLDAKFFGDFLHFLNVFLLECEIKLIFQIGWSYSTF